MIKKSFNSLLSTMPLPILVLTAFVCLIIPTSDEFSPLTRIRRGGKKNSDRSKIIIFFILCTRINCWERSISIWVNLHKGYAQNETLYNFFSSSGDDLSCAQVFFLFLQESVVWKLPLGNNKSSVSLTKKMLGQIPGVVSLNTYSGLDSWF